MSKDYPTIQQHEPLRTPSDWSAQGKRFIAQLEEILDDIYRRFNRLRLKDLDKSLQNTIVESEEGVAQLTVDVNNISGSVDALDGRVADVELTADGLTTEVQDARGSYSTLKQRADSIETNVRDAQGNISSLQQTASGLETRVQTAEGNITTVTQTANGLQTRVGTAEGNISTLQQTATNLTSRVGTAEGNISTIQQQADNIELTVGKLNINGSNLILGGDAQVTNTNYNVAEWAYFEELTIGETYTFTVCLTPAPQASVPYYRMFLSGGTGTSYTLTPVGTAKQILKTSFEFTGYVGTNHVMRLYRDSNTTVSNSTTVHWAKLEKGSQTSDAYTPPPNGSDNLLYNSNVQMVASDASDRWFGDWQCDDLVVGETYTFTACIKPGSDHASFSLNVHGGGELVNVISYKTGGYKQVVSGTFVFAGYTNANRLIACWRRPATVTTAGTLYWAKLCKGVNREAWSPNPNEINNSSIKLTNQGIDILTDGKLNMAGGVEGSLNIPNGVVTASVGDFSTLKVGGKTINSQSYFFPEPIALTHGASAPPSGFKGWWFNASGSTILSASRSGATDYGWINPATSRTVTLGAPSSTMTSGTFTYTLTFGVVNRQNGNPDSITFTLTVTIGGVTFTSSSITLRKWQTQNVTITPSATTTNLFSSTSTLTATVSSNYSGTYGPDLDGTTMTLTAQKSGTSGQQDVTVKFVT